MAKLIIKEIQLQNFETYDVVNKIKDIRTTYYQEKKIIHFKGIGCQYHTSLRTEIVLFEALDAFLHLAVKSISTHSSLVQNSTYNNAVYKVQKLLL